MPSPTGWASLKFQSTHPARGATPHVGQRPVQQAISIHAPREGCDRLYLMALFGTYNNFNPRTPRGVRRPAAWFKIGTGPFQSTHPARGATCKLGGGRKMTPNISIHAPREGCDARRSCRLSIWSNFNPRTPRGVRHEDMKKQWEAEEYFNPRTPRGVRPWHHLESYVDLIISIHAPREGCDGGALYAECSSRSISIHAPREGCDICSQRARAPSWNFNPRTPRGVRLSSPVALTTWPTNFNPRTPRGVRHIHRALKRRI